MRSFIVLLALVCSPGGVDRSASSVLAPPPPAARFDSLRTDFADYLWPTSAGRIVTSTFGEYRRTHFHAGIDISSGDLTGYEVYAARDGFVSRILISPTGYGKMLHLRHTDGYTTTYAHLKKFAPAIEARSVAEQLRRECYPIDIACGPSDLRVRKGDLIAFSGETGTGSPHLHFEIRDRRMNPLNPFLAGALRIGDTIPPVIRKIAVAPVLPGGTVNGRPQPATFLAHPAGRNRFTIREPIVIVGAAGFAVDVRDRIPLSRFLNGVYAHTLVIDGTVHYRVRLDRTPGREAHEIGLYYDQVLLDDGQGRFEKLYMTSPSNLPFYAPTGPWSGVIDDAKFAVGNHSFSITCVDFEGNSAELSGTFTIGRLPAFSASRTGNELRVQLYEPADVRQILIATRSFSTSWLERTWVPGNSPAPRTVLLTLPSDASEVAAVSVVDRHGVHSPPSILAAPNAAGAPGSMTATYGLDGDVVTLRIATDGIFTLPPQVSVREGGRVFSGRCSAVNAQLYTGWFRPGKDFRGIRQVTVHAAVNGRPSAAEVRCDLSPILPGTKGTLAVAGGRLVVEYDSSSVLSPLFLRVDQMQEGDDEIFTLGPDHVVLGDGLTVTLKERADGRRSGIFFRSRGRWELIGERRGNYLSGRLTRTLGDIAVLSDEIPPSITGIAIGGTGGRTPRITFRFDDNLSGVEYEELKVYIDGAVVIPEVDGERRRAVCQVAVPLARGPHQLIIRLMDRMGNSTRTERQFSLR